jgi:hypothetical protein
MRGWGYPISKKIGIYLIQIINTLYSQSPAVEALCNLSNPRKMRGDDGKIGDASQRKIEENDGSTRRAREMNTHSSVERVLGRGNRAHRGSTSRSHHGSS